MGARITYAINERLTRFEGESMRQAIERLRRRSGLTDETFSPTLVARLNWQAHEIAAIKRQLATSDVKPSIPEPTLVDRLAALESRKGGKAGKR